MTVKGLLDSYLKRLRMSAMAKSYARLAEEAASNKADYLDFLCCLLELEVNSKDENTKKERINKAKFPVLKTLDNFKFEEIPSLNKKLVLKLFGGKIHRGKRKYRLCRRTRHGQDASRHCPGHAGLPGRKESQVFYCGRLGPPAQRSTG